ncbi:hypothetical protein WN51_13151 [Melipona quadrifasciata]|uniref:Uncharacterized protein n=1 Tax=Melipona quadrifasciata TaxID=166423 RepID=A0A0M9A1X0_9HYME|nr:hypothetical protein WN51_13151 [Melipona quadrifasciata]
MELAPISNLALRSLVFPIPDVLVFSFSAITAAKYEATYNALTAPKIPPGLSLPRKKFAREFAADSPTGEGNGGADCLVKNDIAISSNFDSPIKRKMGKKRLGQRPRRQAQKHDRNYWTLCSAAREPELLKTPP